MLTPAGPEAGDMATRSPPRGAQRRSVASQAASAAVVTAIVVFGLWGGAVPPLPGLATLALAVATGACLGVALAAYDDDPFGIPLWGLPAFLLVVAGGLFVGGVLFPEGLPTSAEVALLAWAWADVLARVGLREWGSSESESAS